MFDLPDDLPLKEGDVIQIDGVAFSLASIDIHDDGETILLELHNAEVPVGTCRRIAVGDIAVFTEATRRTLH